MSHADLDWLTAEAPPPSNELPAGYQAPSMEAEEGAVAAAMRSVELFDEVSGLIKAEDIATPQLRVLFEQVTALRAESQPVDALTVGNVLRKSKAWKSVAMHEDPLQYARRIADLALTFTEGRTYAELVRDASLCRQLARLGGDFQTVANGEGTAESKLAAAISSLALISDGEEDHGTTTFKEALLQATVTVDTLREGGGGLRGLSTGFRELDEATSGLQDGQLIILAGRPGMGKTLLALNIAENIAHQHRVHFFSLEMSSEDLVMRSMASIARIDFARLQVGKCEAWEWAKLAESGPRLANMKIDIDDRHGISIDLLRARARIAARRAEAAGDPIRLIVVDYLTEVSAKGESQSLRVGEVSKGLRALAKDLNVPVLCLAQLNRDNEKRTDKRPSLADLRDSGQIEQDANVVMFIHRQELYDPDTEMKGIAEVILRKQRAGRLGTTYYNFLGHHQCMTTLDKALPTPRRKGKKMDEALGDGSVF